VTSLRLATTQSSFSFGLSLSVPAAPFSLCCMHETMERGGEGRSQAALRDHVTRHRALNSISIFNPVNGKEKTEKERERTALLPCCS
jgi:hypothetical protein